MASLIDIFMVYQFIKRLVTPFDKTEAFQLGLIDQDGNKLKKADTPEEKKALGYFDRLVFNLKRLLGMVPGGRSRLASYAAALLLLREKDERLNQDMGYLKEEYKKSFDNVNIKQYNELSKLAELLEDAPANATGAAVAGTGTDPVHWSHRQPKMGEKGKIKKYGQPVEGIMTILRRRRRQQEQRTGQNLLNVYIKKESKELFENKIACGQCFNWAFLNYVLNKDKGAILIHGKLLDIWGDTSAGKGNYFDHAWIELDGLVQDWQTMEMGMSKYAKKGWPKDIFYEYWKPKNIKKYTGLVPSNLRNKYKHTGPWD